MVFKAYDNFKKRPHCLNWAFYFVCRRKKKQLIVYFYPYIMGIISTFLIFIRKFYYIYVLS